MLQFENGDYGPRQLLRRGLFPHGKGKPSLLRWASYGRCVGTREHPPFPNVARGGDGGAGVASISWLVENIYDWSVPQRSLSWKGSYKGVQHGPKH